MKTSHLKLVIFYLFECFCVMGNYLIVGVWIIYVCLD